MISYSNESLFKATSIPKKYIMTFDGGQITDSELYDEEVELTERICTTEQLDFGECNASELRFTVGDIYGSLKGKTLNVSMIVNKDADNPLPIGVFKVFSDKPDIDRNYREVVAYDILYDILNTDVSEWYNTILPNRDSVCTLKRFRDSFFNFFGVVQEEITLVNDTMTVAKTIEPKSISGKNVITAICQINGAFGHITRDGKFRYVVLKTIKDNGLFPGNELFPSDTLYPVDAGNIYSSNTRISCGYEDYLVQKIDTIQIREEGGDIGCTYGGTGGNTWLIEGNFLCYGKTDAQLRSICSNLLPVVKDIWYRPFEGEFVGNPCIEVGDVVTTSGRYEVVKGYVLNRTMQGIGFLSDNISCPGSEYREDEINNINYDVQQLRGQTAVIRKDVDEVSVTMTNLETNVTTSLQTMQGEISAKVSSTELASEIQILNGQISSKVSSADLASEVQIQLNQITISSSQINLNGYVSANKNFQIDNNGDLKIVGNGVEATMGADSYGLIIKDNVIAGRYTQLYPEGVRFGKDGYNTISLIIGSIGSTNDVYVGANSASLRLYGSDDRPYYNSKKLALYSDISSSGGGSTLTSYYSSWGSGQYTSHSSYFYNVDGVQDESYNVPSCAYVKALINYALDNGKY